MEVEGQTSGFMTHRAHLLRYLRARGAAEEAEDLLQELWFRTKGIEWERVDDELAYLHRMAHNLLIDRKRAMLRRHRREADYHDSIQLDEQPSTDRMLEARDQLSRLEEAMRALGERTDYIFRRHRLENVPQRVIADELRISLSAVEKHLQKAYRVVGSLAHEDGMPSGLAEGRR